MSTKEFDATVGDLVNYLDLMSEPAKLVRYKLGYIVLGFLFILLILTYLLKKEFWKDIH
jgi:ubiquinol-cytochrome c reductase cytochrome c1 subunit